MNGSIDSISAGKTTPEQPARNSRGVWYTRVCEDADDNGKSLSILSIHRKIEWRSGQQQQEVTETMKTAFAVCVCAIRSQHTDDVLHGAANNNEQAQNWWKWPMAEKKIKERKRTEFNECEAKLSVLLSIYSIGCQSVSTHFIEWRLDHQTISTRIKMRSTSLFDVIFSSFLSVAVKHEQDFRFSASTIQTCRRRHTNIRIHRKWIKVTTSPPMLKLRRPYTEWFFVQWNTPMSWYLATDGKIAATTKTA